MFSSLRPIFWISSMVMVDISSAIIVFSPKNPLNALRRSGLSACPDTPISIGSIRSYWSVRYARTDWFSTPVLIASVFSLVHSSCKHLSSILKVSGSLVWQEIYMYYLPMFLLYSHKASWRHSFKYDCQIHSLRRCRKVQNDCQELTKTVVAPGARCNGR